MNFLEKLDSLMAVNHLNRNTLSKACDIPYTTIDGWYKKGYDGVRITSLLKLADFFGTSLDYWVSQDDSLDTEGKSAPMNDSQKKYLALFDALTPALQECIITIEKELLNSQRKPHE